MTYLGFPISDKHLGVNAFRPVTDKMRKKLQPWKGKNLTSGGRLTLTNSSLSNILFISWGSFFCKEYINKWTQSDLSSFGGGIVASLNITWSGGKMCAYLKTLGVWESLTQD